MMLIHSVEVELLLESAICSEVVLEPGNPKV